MTPRSQPNTGAWFVGLARIIIHHYVLKAVVFSVVLLIVAYCDLVSLFRLGMLHELRPFVGRLAPWSSLMVCVALLSFAVSLSSYRGTKWALALALCALIPGFALTWAVGIPSAQDRNIWVVFCLLPLLSGGWGVVAYLRAGYSWDSTNNPNHRL